MGVYVGVAAGVSVGAGGWVGAGVSVGTTAAIGTLSPPELFRTNTAPTAAMMPTTTTPIATGRIGNPPPLLAVPAGDVDV